MRITTFVILLRSLLFNFAPSSTHRFNQTIVYNTMTMSAITDLFKRGTDVRFKKGDLFVSPHDEPLGIYQINEGFVYSYSKTMTHKKRIQMILKKGDVFPISLAITNDSARNTMYVQALTDGSARMIKKKSFLDFINSSHIAALEIISVLLIYLRIYVDRVENLEEDTVREKLKKRILFFASRFGVNEGKTIRIDLPLTHKLIAESISVSRENVSRELKALEKAKIISFKDRQLFIIDSKRLKKLASD